MNGKCSTIYVVSPKVDQGKQVDLGNRKTVDQNLAHYLGFNLISFLAKSIS